MYVKQRIRLLAFVCAVCVACTVAAQDKFPAKAVTIIVPQTPGGANDVLARILAQKLTENLGQQFIVENRPGAGGNIGTVFAAKAPKDGYTWMLTANSVIVVNPALYKNPGFDPIRDFEPVTPIAGVPYLWVAHPSFAANSIKELIDMAKANPGGIAYASAGNGTPNHLLGEMFKAQAGVDLLHVPYKGASAAATDVMGGRVPVSVQSMPAAISYIHAGKLKVLAVASEGRVRALPDVPAVSETVPGYGSTPWYGIFVPAGTPAPIISRIHAEVVKALAARDLQDKMFAQGAEPTHSTPEQFAALIKSELPTWAQIVKASGMQLD